MSIKLLLRKCISESFSSEGITVEEFNHACEWLDNNLSPDPKSDDYEQGYTEGHNRGFEDGRKYEKS